MITVLCSIALRRAAVGNEQTVSMELVSYPGEQCVEAVDFLPLSDVGIELSNALQSQLLHQVDLVGFLKVLGLQQGHTEN